MLLTLLLLLVAPPAPALPNSDLRTGDVLLVSLPCHLCRLIEEEEGAPFSHLGVVIMDHERPLIADAYHRVAAAPLADFLKIIKPGTHPLVMRPVNARGGFLEINPLDAVSRFHETFEGLSYDPQFLWDNRDERGEKLYCSEFVAKFLNPYLAFPVAPKPMHFTADRAAWVRYFKGRPPDGKPGISPADFSRAPGFQSVGVLHSE